MSSYEVEIKCLLGDKSGAESLVRRMKEKDPALQEVSFHKQLNHYFIGGPASTRSPRIRVGAGRRGEAGDLNRLYENIVPFLGVKEKEQLQLLAKEAKNFSLRTRWADGEVILVLKISIDEGTSFNTIGRREFEAKLPSLSLEELDQLVLKSGLEYQAKWSRERTEYKYLGTNVTIDKNAGYGYLAEFEKVVDDEAKVPEAKFTLKQLMKELDLEELPQDRLERMFAYYNAHWQDYYGTDKVFVVE